jgi:pimeloyl-ACP methyl ester carboxylesterase
MLRLARCAFITEGKGMLDSTGARRKWRGLTARRRTVLVPTLLALLLLGLLTMASAASAAPIEGPEGEEFYTPPASTPAGVTGELIWYRPATVNLNVALPSNQAWSVLYQSTGQQGQPDFVTGTVIVPTAAWTGKGARPVVTIGIGTQGLAHECAPSLQMADGTEYDAGEIIAALKAGYAVAITDYQGYTTGNFPTYIAGKAEGQAVLDIVRAMRELPGIGITETNPVIAWGYSQGGQAVGWAGELQPSYAPNVKLIGVAAGGVPGNLKAVAAFGNGGVGAAFSLDSVIGLQEAYGAEFNDASFTTIAGRLSLQPLLRECALASIEGYRGTKVESQTIGGITFEQVQEEFPNVKRILEEQQLGTKTISVPVYHYHGLEDEFVPVTQDVELHQAWCSLGVKDDFQLYPGDHLLTDPTAIPTVMKWLEERVAGKTAPSTCGQHKAGATLPSTARLTPETGDLIVPLPAWQLKGTVTEKKSGIAIEVPSGSTLSAEGDLTNETLTAQLSIPPINQTVSILGIPIKIKGALTPTGTITGKVSLTNSGVLSQSAVGDANMLVGSVGVGFFQVPIGCKTTEPIALPLSISEPVNALETGGFGINTEVTVPEFGGCGLFGPVLSSLMSGPNNPISITASPPPPINW